MGHHALTGAQGYLDNETVLCQALMLPWQQQAPIAAAAAD